MSAPPTHADYQLSQLDQLEAESIHIFREVAAEFEKPVLMFSGGKDSIVMLRLAEKAFYPAKLPFPLLQVDTGLDFPEVLDTRDSWVNRLGARLVVANSCVSHGFARAFVLAGAQNYLGTWWRVADRAAAAFSLALYEELVLGRPLGEALSIARTALRARDPLHWAAYVHYGDPDTRLITPQARTG